MNVYSGKIEVRDDPLVLGTEPIPARYYYDPEWYELERKAVFLRSWLNVGHVCELPEPGSFIRRELEFARASLLIVRGKDGVIRAFHNVCTHRGTQLTDEASGKKTTFSCRYHMWTFGTDGALISAPDFERFEFPMRRLSDGKMCRTLGMKYCPSLARRHSQSKSLPQMTLRTILDAKSRNTSMPAPRRFGSSGLRRRSWSRSAPVGVRFGGIPATRPSTRAEFFRASP